MKGKYFLSTLLLFSFFFSVGQHYDTISVGHRITEVSKKGDNYILRIEAGSNVGLSSNSAGSLWGIERKEIPNHIANHGEVQAIEVFAQHSILSVTTESPVLAGDLVFLNTVLRNNGYRSPPFYLWTYGIDFVDDNGTPMYSFAELNERDGHGYQTEKFLQFKSLINRTGEELQAKHDKRKVVAGPHEGKLLSEVLMNTDTLDVWFYMYYVTQEYMKTLGQTFKLSDHFANYALQGDLISMDLLYNKFVSASDEEINTLVKQYRRLLTSAALDQWVENLRTKSKEGDYETPETELPVITRVARLVEATDVVGNALYLQAGLAFTQDNYQQAIDIYLQVLPLYANSDLSSASVYNYLALAYTKTNEPARAEECFKKRVDLLQNNAVDDEGKEKLYKALNDYAEHVSSLGKKREAEQIYKRALQIATDLKNNRYVGSTLWSIGYLADESRPDEAIDIYKRAATKYLTVNDTTSTVDLLRNCALVSNRQKRFGNAKRYAEDAMKLAKANNKQALVAYVLELMGTIEEESAQYAPAIRYYLDAESIHKSLPDTAKWAAVIKKLGNLYIKLKDTKTAVSRHLQRIPLNKKDTTEMANAYWEAAYAYSESHLYKESNEMYQKSIRLFELKADTANLKNVYTNVAFNYRDLRDSVNAYKWHERAMSFTRHARDRSLYAYAMDKAAKTLSHFKNYRKQIQLHMQVVELYKTLNDRVSAAAALESIAEGYSSLKQFDKCRDNYKTAIDLYHAAGDKANEAEAYWDYAYNFGTNMNDFNQAIAQYEIAYPLFMSVGDSVNASTMLSNIGQNYWSKLDYEHAIEFHRKAIELASKCRNMKRVANSWSKLATLYTESNNPVASREALHNAVSALEQVNDSTELANTFTELADNYLKSKDYPQAIATYNKSLNIRKALHDSIGWANNLANIGGFYQNRSENANAIKYYHESLALRRKIKDKQGQVYTLANLASIEQYSTADYKKAEAYLREAIKLATEVKDDYILGYCYSGMKGLYKSKGDIKTAKQYSDKTLSMYRKTNNWKSVAGTLVDIGYDAHYSFADIKMAMIYFDSAQALIDTIPDSQTQANIFSARASVLRETGEFQKALDMANKSLKLYKDLDNLWGIAGVYIDLGNIYKQMTEYDKAIIYQTKADSLYQKMTTEYARLAPLANLGDILSSQGDYKKGLEYYERSLAILQKAGDMNDNLAILKGCVGESYLYLENFELSEKALRESMEICDKIQAWRAKADYIGVLGRLKIEQKKYDEALKYLNEGVSLSKKSGITLSYVNNLLLLGKAELEQKHYDKARPALEETVTISRNIGKRTTLWEGLYLLGLLYKNSGDLKTSKTYLKESVVVIEEIRNKVSGGDEARKMFSSDKQIVKVYDALIDVLLQLGETEEAMSYLQKNNEENLKAKFKSLDVKYENQDRNRALADERAMKAKLDGIEEQIGKEKMLASDKQNVQKLKSLEGIKTIAENEYLKFINQQINVQPELSRFFNNSVQPTQFRKVKKQIPTDMALLSYLCGENQLYIFVATTDTVIAKIITVPAATINKNVNAILNVVKNHMGSFPAVNAKDEKAEREEIVLTMKQADPYLKPFEQLYQILVAPVANEISTKKRLAVIPTGSLNYIPFQMLGKTLSSGKFSLMANQFSIFYTSSTDMLFRLMQEEDKNINILAFGNPDKTLPSTEKEVQAIKQLYPSATVYLRDDATEDKAKFAGENFNVMHFATHGNLDYEDFTKSFLTMAGNPSKREDGMLTLEELWGMDVMNHLNIVVLSACQTAVTKGSHENSPVSPASGFLQNGVKSVVATLWKVDDEATSLLIADFYKNLKKMEAIDALRSAQVTLAQNPKFSHPYYWAGMVLLGDWR